MPDAPSNPFPPPERSLCEISEPRRNLGPKPDGTAEGSAYSLAPSDAALLELVAGRDQRAMAEIFRRYGGLVYSIALRVLKDRGHAEDLTQEVFFQVWRNPGAFQPNRGALGAWLVVVARNRAIDSIRRRRPTDSLDDHVLPSAANLADEAERDAMMRKVRGAMSNLPQEQRIPLELAYFEGLTQTEIAERTGDPLGTVKTRIRLALTTLRRSLQV